MSGPQTNMMSNQMQPANLNYFMNNQNVNPNLQAGLQPMVNSFISGLLMNLSNTPQRQNHQIEKGKIEILEGILESMKKERNQDSFENQHLAKSRKENEMMETLLRELNRETEPDPTISAQFSQSNLQNNQDKGWIPSKVFTQRSRPRISKKVAPPSSKTFKPKIFSNSFNTLSKSFGLEKFLELDVVVNYLNHSKNLKNMKVNPNCKLDLFIEGILKKVEIFGSSLQNVKQSAEIFFDGEKFKSDQIIKSIPDIESSQICLNINVLFKKNEGKLRFSE